jgi:hypothetical protein
MAEIEKCRICGADKDPEVRHAHCKDCGCVISKGKTRHSVECSRLNLPPGAVCPKCKRLLAAGAHCPDHGNPLEVMDG